MLSGFPVNPTIAASDLDRARAFYENVLGLVPVPETLSPNGVLYSCGYGTMLYLYRTRTDGSVHHPANFSVPNIELVMDALIEKGIVFEQFDTPGMETDEKGIAFEGGQKIAWFKDPDGNVLSLMEVAF